MAKKKRSGAKAAEVYGPPAPSTKPLTALQKAWQSGLQDVSKTVSTVGKTPVRPPPKSTAPTRTLPGQLTTRDVTPVASPSGRYLPGQRPAQLGPPAPPPTYQGGTPLPATKLVPAGKGSKLLTVKGLETTVTGPEVRAAVPRGKAALPTGFAPYKPGLVPLYGDPQSYRGYQQATKRFAAFVKTHPDAFKKTNPAPLGKQDYATYQGLRTDFMASEGALKTSLAKPPKLIDTTKPASLDQRYEWALRADPASRKKFVASMSPADKKRAIEDWNAMLEEQAHPHRDLLHWALHGAEQVGEKAYDVGKGMVAAGGPTNYAVGQIPGTAEAAGKTALALGQVLEKPIAAKIGEIKDTLVSLRQSQGATPSTFGTGGLPPSVVKAGLPYGELASAVVKPQTIENVGGGLAKLALGVPTIPAGLVRHPLRAATELLDMIRGGGDMLPALTVLLSPKVSVEQRNSILHQLWKGLESDLASKYGPDVTWGQALRGGYDRPVIQFFDALTVFAPAAKALDILRFMRGGATLSEARALSRTPALLEKPEYAHVEVPYKPRTVTVRAEHAGPQDVQLGEARSPLGRGMQKSYDVAGRAVERIVGDTRAARTPFTPTRRGLRQKNRELRRNVHRLQAEAAAHWRDVTEYTGHVGDAATARKARLFYTAEKPSSMSEEVWLKGLIADAQDHLDNGPVKGGRRDTATEAKLQRKLDGLKAQVDRAARDRWFGRIADVHHERGRLTQSLLHVEERLKVTRDAIRFYEGGGEPDAVKTGRGLERHRADEKTLLNQRKATREQLTGLDPHEQVPVHSDIRQAIEEAAAQMPRVDPEQTQSVLQITDHLARSWGREHNRDPGEWYSDPTGFGIRGVHFLHDQLGIPEDALKQISAREPYVRNVLPEGRTLENLQQAGLSPRRGETAAQALARGEREIAKRSPKNAVRTSTHSLGEGDNAIDLTGIVEIGRPSDEQWFERAHRVFRGDLQVMKDWLEWYEQAHDILLEHVGGDEGKAETLMAGFVASQANASPAGGINAVLQALWKRQRGETITKKMISAAITQINTALDRGEITSGFAAKLSDFADALARRETRTWMRDVPAGRKPAPVDVHGIRDSGFLTHRLAARAIERGYDVYFVATRDKKGNFVRPEHLPEAVKLIDNESEMPKGGVLADSGDGTTGLPYENVVRFYEDKANFLNRYDNGNGFLGRTDWQPAHAQALGWGAIQAFWGTEPDSIISALEANTLRYVGMVIGHPRRTAEITNEILGRTVWHHQDMETIGNHLIWKALVPKKIKRRALSPEDEALNTLIDEGPFTHVFSIREGEKKYSQAGNTQMLTLRGEEGSLVKAVANLHDELPQLHWAVFVPNPDGSISFLFRDVRAPSARKITIHHSKLTSALNRVKQAGKEEGYSFSHERTRAEVTFRSRVRSRAGEDARRLGAFDEPGGLAGRERPGGADQAGQVRGGAPAEGEPRAVGPGRTASVGASAAAAPDFLDASSIGEAEVAAFNEALGKNERNLWVSPLKVVPNDDRRLITLRHPDGSYTAGGVVSGDGYISNLFSNETGMGEYVLHRLVQEGGKVLDCFDGYLPARYAEDLGFREVARAPFSERYAPEGWDYAKHGRPDMVFMAKVDDPAYRTAGYVRDYATGYRMMRDAAQRGRVLAQTREADTLGAVEFLTGPDGGRILYLTKQGDLSTLLHELFGHAVREIRTAYPEEFAKVEDRIGRPFEEWSVPDHEQFARWWERYFAEGRAPSPELVPAFQHIKTWMRSIYGTEKKISKAIPPEVIDLLDGFFGAYDDNNVFRIAQMASNLPERYPVDRPGFARAGAVTSAETRLGRYQPVMDFTSEELAALRRRNDTRAFNRSLEGMEKQFAAAMKAAQDRGGADMLPEAEQEALLRLDSNLMVLRTEKAIADGDRETGLRKRISYLEEALKDLENPAFPGALAALEYLSGQRESILRSVFGSRYDEIFAGRRDMVASYLADKSLIPSDYGESSNIYAPHAGRAGLKNRLLAVPARPLVGTTIGKTDPGALGLHFHNDMIRWQNGDVHADPHVILESWQNAQAFAFVDQLKRYLDGIARELEPHEPIPSNAYVINVEGVPVPELQKLSMKPASEDHAADILDALQTRDPQKLELVITKYVNDVLKPPEDVQAWLEEQGGLTARTRVRIKVIDKSIVEALFRPLRGSTNPVGTGFDIANTLARWSLIYTNPAYIPVNFIGNLFFLGATGGPRALGHLVSSARLMWSDKKLMTLVAGEVGEVPAIAALSRGRAANRWISGLRHREEQALRYYTAVPDRLPRMALWINEARKEGYTTKEQMYSLFDKSETHAKARDRISEKATEGMVNFDRLSDWERLHVTRFLFIWPWVRGATAWPFYFTKEFPFTAGVASNVGTAAEERRQQIMGNVSPQYRDMFPLSSKGGYASVINTGSISPTSTAAQSISAIVDNVQSLIQSHKPSPLGNQLTDFMMPLWSMAIEMARQQDNFGRPSGYRDIFLNNLGNFVPDLRLAQSMVNPNATAKIFTDRDRAAVLGRRMLRLGPQTIDLTKMQGYALQLGKKTIEQRVSDSEAALRKSTGVSYIPATVHRALVMQQVFYDLRDKRIKDIKDKGDWHPSKPSQKEPNLTNLDEANIVRTMYQRFAPDSVPPDPATLSPAGRKIYADVFLYGSAEYGVPGLLGALSAYRSEARKAKAASS